MRTLEARFHPLEREGRGYIVVGHVSWSDRPGEREPEVRVAPSLARASAPATMLATLRHLVRMTAPRTFERLEGLQSRYWSFVPVADAVKSSNQEAEDSV